MYLLQTNVASIDFKLNNNTLNSVNNTKLHVVQFAEKHTWASKKFTWLIPTKKKIKKKLKKDSILPHAIWRFVKYSGMVKITNERFYDKNKLYDLRLIRAVKLRYATAVFYFSGKKYIDEKIFGMGLIKRIKKRNILKQKKLVLKRWMSSFIFKTKARLVKSYRRLLKSSGMYLKMHVWKFRKSSQKQTIRNLAAHWVRNNVRRVHYFKGGRINARFKLITLAEFNIAYRSERRRRKVNVTRALDYRAWKKLINIEEFYQKFKFGGADTRRIRKQEGLSRMYSWALMSKKRKSYKKKTVFGLTELAGILNPIMLKKHIGHPFHLVTPSVLPFTLSIAFLCVFQNLLGFMWFEGWHHQTIYQYHAFFFINLFAVIISWILEIFKEEQTGAHTVEIQKGFQYAILLFILSELMLFFSFFWAYFHYTLNSNSFMGGTYTPKGLVIFYWHRIPLLNTLLLLASGLSLTIGHILLVESDKIYRLRIWVKLVSSIYTYRIWGMIKGKNDAVIRVVHNLIKKHLFWVRYKATLAFDLQTNSIRYSRDGVSVLPRIFLLKYKGYEDTAMFTPGFWVLDTTLKGFVFLMYQAYEYTSSMFSINDSVYGAVFFSLTGLHGLHVFIGVMSLFTYLLVALARDTNELYIVFDKINYRRYKRVRTFMVKQPSCYKLKYFNHRIAFDGAAWYWHFVDVVWFFVFIFVYWWGFTS